MDAKIICDFLNYLFQKDKKVIENLINSRVSCGKKFIEDDFVIVTEDDKVGIIGVLNGLIRFSNLKDTIQIVENDSNELIGFSLRGE
jgi:hypothetical protein